MSEKFRKAVNAPHRAMARVSREIEAQCPTTIGGMLEKEIEQIEADAFRFLLWATKYVALDNHLLRAGGRALSKMRVGKNKQGQPKVLPAYMKNNPNKSAYLIYYLAAMMTLGGVMGYKKITEKEDAPARPKTEQVTPATEVLDGTVSNVAQAEKTEFDDWKINSSMDDAQWNQKIQEIEPYLVANLILHEGVYNKVYRDGAGRVSGTPTIGIGFTINDGKHINFANRILGRDVKAKNFTISVAESKKLALAWAREEIYPRIKQQFKGDIDARLFIALTIAAYNRGEHIFDKENSGRSVCTAVNKGVRGQELANIYVRAFAGTRKTKWGGLANKYAVLALYYTGAISNQVILDAAAEGVYKLEDAVEKYYQGRMPKNTEAGRLVIYDKGGKPIAFLGPKTIEKMLFETREHLSKGELQKKVNKYIGAVEIQKISAGNLFGVGANKQKVGNKKTAFNDAAKKLGNNAYSAGFDLSDLTFGGHGMA